MPVEKQKLLFVGASGAVARKVLPTLAGQYSIVGISRAHDEGRSHCVDFYTGDILHDHETVFTRAFEAHRFDAIIWNVVRYFPGPLHEATRGMLHTEFDLGVALPIACLQFALRNGFGEGSPFILVSSQLAFGRKASWGSYSIVKNGQVILAKYLADELSPRVVPRIIAPGSVPAIPDAVLSGAFIEALTTGEGGRTIYIVDENGVR